MISPLRRDVLLVAFVLAIPVLLLGLRGDMALAEVVARLPWCLGAAWAAVALVRWASAPRSPTPSRRAPAAEEPNPSA
jgi:hypothetical protein